MSLKFQILHFLHLRFGWWSRFNVETSC